MTISITDDARARVLEVRGREHDPQGLTLWVEVVGIAANAYTYDMAFLRRDEIDPTDLVTEAGEIAIVVPQTSAAYLDGATIALDGRLGGGCTGCGMAAVTLRQGIEAAIRSSVPEIARVVDVTDHTSGTNPYYAAT